MIICVHLCFSGHEARALNWSYWTWSIDSVPVNDGWNIFYTWACLLVLNKVFNSKVIMDSVRGFDYSRTFKQVCDWKSTDFVDREKVIEVSLACSFQHEISTLTVAECLESPLGKVWRTPGVLISLGCKEIVRNVDCCCVSQSSIGPSDVILCHEMNHFYC